MPKAVSTDQRTLFRFCFHQLGKYSDRLLVEARKILHISKELGIAEQTVRNHVSNIYYKLGIHNQIEIVRYVNQIRYFLENAPADD